ncbi:16S rRNA (cytosine(1402)-N(4))-methyltransferase RsmH [Salipiger thiooxidans]|jgi:16S rRNA (cytosine1402-N4)-methyltransferase|uniref:16S rRNA (cytosine(1402)-N(4))-methyltransferase RsmH n=1 Tax=Salipiger thiooxidans TaxID=282683 RepID=UPI001CD2DD7B|nr:16S rRNA (cytosine(1402)-N(4))-methyltransferase RsmH [Salipiger thiooxidans]MBR9836256.1 16S rRNA (cytosine(1402)-N(4))-methyltransferase RsmH [Paracoccaceae bacterium]MCA0849707.1 16S rRNA (cytosine(1402)-N(4))-methyltransferase RsmH [Salipiger thiooxidans]
MAPAADTSDNAPHVPVLLRPLLDAVAPVSGTWVDGTFGAGGYARGLLEAGADKVIGIDRDPLAHRMAAEWIGSYGGRLELVEGNFADMDQYVSGADGVVLDLGVSSMQLDIAERGFSFQKDGPLDMRMEQAGESAAELVKRLDETTLADVLYTYGEERASRRIARAIVKAREQEPIETTARLSAIVEACLPRPKPGQSHPATRSFQALRIAVNDEYGALWRGLMAAEKALKPGGFLCVVTFHSVEDRMVKRFLQARSGRLGAVSRYAPVVEAEEPQFVTMTRKAIGPDDDELAANPRSRSARLRIGQRTSADPGDVSPDTLNMPQLKGKR